MLFFAPPPRAAQAGLTVFAASSLTDSMKAVAAAYQAKTGTKVTLSFGGSNTLAQQIDQGASADLFMSADTDWMDFLQKNNRIANDTRRNLLGNRLVLIGGSASKPLTIAPQFDLAGALGDGRLALADPDAVPAGKYGKAALTALGVWDSVADKIAPAENVRVAMEYVARGEAPYGIVYETDAKVDPGVHVVGAFPENSHPPIVYPVALTKTAAPQAQGFPHLSVGAGRQGDFRESAALLALPELARADIIARRAAMLFQKHDAFDHHGAVRRFQHVIDGQARHRHRHQGFHFHPGLGAWFWRGRSRPGRGFFIGLDRKADAAQRNLVAERDQVPPCAWPPSRRRIPRRRGCCPFWNCPTSACLQGFRRSCGPGPPPPLRAP